MSTARQLAPESAARSKRVLFVDQNQQAVEQVRDLLNEDGYEIVTARDVRELLLGFDSREPDIVLLDLEFSIMDGIKLLDYIRTLHPDVPIITMVDASLKEVALLSIKAGASGVIFKPVDGVHLRKLIHGESR